MRVDDQVFPAGARDFSIFHSVQAGSGAHPASCLVDMGGFSSGVKQPELEADHYLYVFVLWCIIKY
jgi:hypothetical protein